tara:strand:- start:114 stop:308 length:195 start_codon:yes stop_codon:yes gene_type:complete
MNTLQNKMKDGGYSLRALARLIAVSPSLLSRMINGYRTFRFEHKKNIAMVLNCTTEDIQWPDHS